MERLPDLAGKVALVTGGNSGIGLETVRALAGAGAHVVLAARHTGRGNAARDGVLATHPDARVEVRRLDLARLKDVRRFVDEFARDHDRLDILVNNAGIHTARRALTEDGVELTFATNYLGHFVLTTGLLDLLRASAPARVVHVASDAHRGTPRLDMSLATSKSGRLGIRAYNHSKLCNVLFGFALARRLEGSGVTSNVLHPGTVRTGWARGEESGAFRHVVALASPFLISPEKGARTVLHLAASPAVEGITGKYFVRERPRVPSRVSRDVEAQETLWRESERLADQAPMR